MKRLTKKERIGVFVSLVAITILFIIPLFQYSILDIFLKNLSGATSGGSAISGNLIMQDIIVGEGREAAIGDTITVHYVGAFEDGTVFDDSNKRGRPFSFLLGSGQVIDGWDKGIVGMKAGGKRILIVPPRLGYGDEGNGSIPPGAVLIFEVVLLKIEE